MKFLFLSSFLLSDFYDTVCQILQHDQSLLRWAGSINKNKTRHANREYKVPFFKYKGKYNPSETF